jgi:predicted alpha/beta superfamily hydrolase
MVEMPLSDGSGVITRHADFPSHDAMPRNVDVWLPPDYSVEPARRFPVLYMHDGQNLFDPAIVITGTDWGVDEAITGLAKAGKIRTAIVAGVWNGEKRWLDYIPQKPLETPEGENFKRKALQMYGEEFGGEIQTDHYLRFLVEELKPFIDQNYRSLPGREDTFVMGSSMGGLASLYALCEYPEIFRGAGCLSTHWPAGEEVIVEWLKEALPKPGAHKLYFDYGTATLDALYEPFQMKVDAIMRAIGYQQGKDWVTHKFPGAEHNEAAWRARVCLPLEFLLGINKNA